MTITELLDRNDGQLFGSGGLVPPSRRSVHITDMRTFMMCRRKWDFESLLRRGLQPALLPEPLFLGQGVHIGLDYGYRDSLANGGTMKFNAAHAVAVFKEWAEQRVAALTKHAGQLWEDEAEVYENAVQLGKVMLTHYGLWADRVDHEFEVLGLEKKFRVNVPGSMRVAYEGRFDGLVQHRGSGELYILEFKTSKSLSDSRLSTIFRDMQSVAYQWAAQKVYGRPIVGVLYRILWKKEPDMPWLTSRGKFSRNKQQHMTEFWLDHALAHIEKTSEIDHNTVMQAAAELRHMIREKQEHFFAQRLMRHSNKQLQDQVRVLRTIGGEMASPGTEIFPMPGFHCSFCRFKDPCDLMMNGHDDLAEDVLQAEFAPRTYWEDFELGEDD